jgi:predicted nuclease with TOPRIM domain
VEANGFAGVHDDGRIGIHSQQPAVLSREESVALAIAVLRQQGMLAQLEERRALYDNLAATQRRCKELLEENRRLERENSERGLALLDMLQMLVPIRERYRTLFQGVGSDEWVSTRRYVGQLLESAHERVRQALGVQSDKTPHANLTSA